MLQLRFKAVCKPALRAKAGPVLAVIAVMLSSLAVCADTYHLLAVKEIGAPAVSEKELIYRTNLVFKIAPESYWIFYDRQEGFLVVDIYGAKLEMKTEPDMSGNNVFKGMKIENLETSMSLSGEQARLYLKAEAGWRFESQAISKSVIQISARKVLAVPKPVKRKNRRVVLYILAAVAASAGTFLLIIFIGKPGD